MAVNIIRSKKQKKKETIIFAILCVLIGILLIGNILALIYILNSGTKQGSPSFISDNNRVIGHVLENQKATNNSLILNGEILNPGDITSKSIQIENYGNQEVYIRIYCEFQVSVDNENYITKDFVDLVVDAADENWIKSSEDYKYYSTAPIGKSSTINLDVEFVIKEELIEDDLYENYKTCQYKLFVHIETLSANGITLHKTADEIANGWK